MRVCGVYFIKNLITEKVYVGSSIDIFTRWSRHRYELVNNKHHSAKLQNSFNKHGENAFVYCLAQSAENRAMATKIEQEWIIKLNAIDNGYNVNPIANNIGMMPKTEEHKKKIGLAHIGRKLSEESKDKIRKAHIGKANKPFTEETIKKMSASKLGKKPMTDDGKKRLSEYRKSTVGKKRGKYKPRNVATKNIIN
jgi:group I intron endonuclease